MKISAVVVGRNDNYGGHLADRAIYSFNSAIETYDEVFYIDWNSDTHSLFYDIRSELKFKGNFKHIVINPKNASILTNNDPDAQKVCEVLARNIGLVRAEGDYLLSTNIDIIHPRREELEAMLKQDNQKSFYTISRRHTDWDEIKTFHGGELRYGDWKELREHLITNSEERHFEEKTVTGDDYSLINCCGDFQIAHRNVWHSIKGMEEALIYSLYADTNVQKKAAMHGFDLKAIYNPALFHIEHGKGGGGFLDGINKKTNDPYRAIVWQLLTENSSTWGFSDIAIDYEIC